MKDTYILGIESSCDETSCSIVKNGREEIATSTSTQISIHENFGGVVPEIASREHVKNITFVIEDCLKKANMKIEEVDAIAVTYGPGLIGSLLVGLEAAKTLSFVYNKPLIPVHHIAGHIYANSLVEEFKFPLIALVVSGGHTELIKMNDHLSFEKLGGTLDDPGGPKLDKLAHTGEATYQLPMPLNDDSYNFSFSGLKSAVINLAHKEKQNNREINQQDLACSFQNVAIGSIINKTKKALKNENINNLIVAGGVAANGKLREEVAKLAEEMNINYSIPPLSFCTDNAAMIAAAGYYLYKKGIRADFNLNAQSSINL